MQAERIQSTEGFAAQTDRQSVPRGAVHRDLRFQSTTFTVRAVAAVFAVMVSAGTLGAVLALYDSAAPAATMATVQPPIDRLAVALAVESRMAATEAALPGPRPHIPTKPVCSTVRNLCA
jgi:hypothetical protein